SAVFTLRGEMQDRAALLEAYAFDPSTGDIIYAPDQGPEGDVRYPRQVYGRAGLKRPIIVFPCAAISLYDLVDERYFETLEQLFVFDARDFSEPINYGYSLPDTGATGGELPSYVEPCAVVYSPRDIDVQIAMGMGLLGLRMVLTNGPDRQAFKDSLKAVSRGRDGWPAQRLRYEGYGFPAATTRAIPFTPYKIASDMWVLDEGRMSELRQRGIRNRRLDELHRLADISLRKAEEARAKRQHDKFIAYARHAWAYESRAYPDVQRTATDVVKGVLFYLAMLLPFAYFAERLLFAVPDIRLRIVVTFAVFAIVFSVLFLVHPAFKLPRLNPMIILLSFIILALAVIVIAIVTGKFNETLRQMKREEGGQHEADVGRWSAAAAAFALGLGNMRRRKTRTALTAITLILLTFTVLSFMSVESWIRPNKIRLAQAPAYQGIMIRDRSWSSLEEPTADIVANELGDRGWVAPRAWFSSPDIEKEIFIDVTNVADQTKTYAANVLLGLSPAEADVTPMADTLLPGGRWFVPGEKDACILPASVAVNLGIAPGDVGRAEVSIFGGKFRVVGLLSEKEFRQIRDLDGETLSPVNYAQLRPEIIQQIKQQAAQRFKLGTEGTASLLQEYRHYAPYSLVILPYRTVMDLGGTLRSIAIRFREGADVARQVARLVKRYALSLYAGEGEHTYLYSSVGLTKVGRLGTLAVPILIAALIVLNTMLGAVYERTKEIAIFSSIGLAPIHVSMLFLAEASVFANIGAIIGYLLGQVVSKVLDHFNALAGIELNYSSLAAVGVTVIVVAVVLLSTLWPSKKAAQIASPGLERKWRMPEPEGDTMTLVLPFTVTGRDAIGSCAFLKEYFDEFVGFAGGEFLAEDVQMNPVESEEGTGIQVSLRMWLAPYDLGVSQRFELNVEPTGEAEIYSIRLRLLREAGDITSWIKTNSLFLTALRKQFLIWRT
ncbi:MAG: ABC transporter permease, partial [Armatimonadota bacterium]